MRTRSHPPGLLGLASVLGVVALAPPLAPPLLAQSAPVLSTAPHNGEHRSASFCAADCFDAVASYSTPAYVSLDQARSATLVYSSAQAAPRALVQVDANDTSSTAPTKMSIRLKRADGSWVTFTTGTQEIFYSSGSGTSRLAAQFDASTLSTGAYTHTVVVRSWRSDGTFAESSAPLRVLVQNEQDSPYGAGWTIAGLQRARPQADGSVLITEGDGSILFFAKTSAGYDAPAGDFSTLSYDGTNYRRAYPDGTRIKFYSTGRQESVEDRFGNRTTFSHNSTGALGKITDPVGKTITFSYTTFSDGNANVTISYAGRKTQLGLNAARDLTAILDYGGSCHCALDATYDSSHRMRTRTDRRGKAWAFAYDHAGKVSADTMPQVSADGALVRPVVAFRSWDTEMLPASGKGSSSSPATRVVPSNMRAEIRNARGFITYLSLDRFGAPTRISEPLGRLSYLTRNSDSQVTRSTAPSGHQTDFTWSGPNLTKSYDRTTGRTVNLEYEPTYHEVTRISGDTEPVWNYWSGGTLDSTRVGDAARPTARYTYDSRGRLLTARDPRGHGTTVFYDGGNVWGNADSVRVGPRRHAFSYDGFGRRIATRDASDRTSTVQYDSLNRVLRSIGPRADTTTYTYDGFLTTSVKDAKGQLYQFSPNALGWTESETDPTGKVESYAYDRNGNVKTRTNRRGQQVTFTYDDLDQMRSRTADGKTTSFATDPDFRFVATANAESTDTVRFDVLGRPTSTVTVRGGTRYVLQSTFDRRSLRTQLTMTSPWSRSVGYRYNAEMQLDTLIDLSGGRTHLGYDVERGPASVRLPTGMSVTLGSPSTHRGAVLRYSVTGVDDRFGLGYRHGRRGEMTERVNVFGDSSRTFLHDEAGQLLGFKDYRNSSPSCTWDEDEGQRCTYGSQTQLASATYGWDKVGNPTHGSAQTATGNRLTRINGYTFEYDADGNVTRKSKVDGSGNLVDTPENLRVYWNSLNRIDSVYVNGVKGYAYMEYDGFGRRVRKHGSTDAREFVYVYDGDDILMILDEQGGVRQEFAHYPGTDRPHSVRKGDGTIYYYLTDDPGNVIGTVNASNQVVEQMRYTPFGKFEVQNVTVAPLAYMGALLDEGYTYYLRNRWYDPDLQRFLSEDPIGLAGGINPYTFVGNSPMEGRDPSGLDHCTALQESLNNSDGSHGCGGKPVSFTPLTVTATPKTQTVNVGSTSRGYTGMAFNSGSSSSGRYGGGGGGGGAQPIPQPVLGTFLHDPRITPQTCNRRLGFTTTGRARIRTHRGRIAINSATWDLTPVEVHRKYFFGLIGQIVRVEYAGEVTARGPSAVAELPAIAGADCVAGDVYATGWDVF